MNNYLLILIIAVLSLVIGGFLTHYTLDKPIIVKETSTVFMDTGKVKAGEMKIIKVQKPVSIAQLDSIYAVAKEWAIENTPHDTVNRPVFGLFTVSHDTSFVNPDSTVRLEAHNEVSSMLPFYKSKFNDTYKITSTPKTITVKEAESSFGFVRGFILGPNYDVIHKTFGISITLGYGFKF
jgi:hypothetical protein